MVGPDLVALVNRKMEKVQEVETLLLQYLKPEQLMEIKHVYVTKYLTVADMSAWLNYANNYLRELELLAKRCVK